MQSCVLRTDEDPSSKCTAPACIMTHRQIKKVSDLCIVWELMPTISAMEQQYQ